MGHVCILVVGLKDENWFVLCKARAGVYTLQPPTLVEPPEPVTDAVLDRITGALSHQE